MDVKQHIQQKILPKLPSSHHWTVFNHAIPTTLEGNPAPWQISFLWNKIALVLPHIPGPDRWSFLKTSLSPLLSFKPTTQAWQSIVETLPKIPAAQRLCFIDLVTPAVLENNPNELRLKHTFDALSKIIPEIPEKHLKAFFAGDLQELLDKKPNRSVWQNIFGILPLISKQYRVRFFRHVLPVVMRRKSWPADVRQALDAYSEIRPRIHKDARRWFFSSGLPALLSSKLLPEKLPAQVDVANQYLSRYPEDYFFGKVVAENFGQLVPPTHAGIRRFKFRKTGSRLVPLAGNLTGILIRRVDPASFNAWKAAYEDPELKEHVEPILEKNGRLRYHPVQFRRKGSNSSPKNIRHAVWVSTRHVGIPLWDFIQNNPEHAAEASRQEQWITHKLQEKGIKYAAKDASHLHSGNFLVEMISGHPRVRLIDFDQAKLIRKKRKKQADELPHAQ